MNQLQTQKGSGIICILMAMGGLLTVMSLIVRYTTFGIDIAHQRVLYEQHYFALRGLLNYGLMLAEKSNVTDLLTIELDTWLTHYTGKIVLSKEQNMVNVHASLYFTPTEFIDMQHAIAKNENP